LREKKVTSDFYCDEALSGRTPVRIVMETEDVLAFHHTRPYWALHIVVIPKVHIPSLTDLGGHSVELLHRLTDVVRQVASQVEREHGACRVVTNLGEYQDSKHLHFHVGFGEIRKR
jgi:histidine triad (HIT) family protein